MTKPDAAVHAIAHLNRSNPGPIMMRQFNWSPGIGDPTVIGWLTVVLYLVAAAGCWRLWDRLRGDPVANQSERLIWGGLAVMYLALGINKQLDLQTALTEAGRVLASYQGWYEWRRAVQLVFIAGVVVAGGIALEILLRGLRNAPFAAWLAMIGTLVVVEFVMIRAASFHHVDVFLGMGLFGARWNWILEIGGIGIVLVAVYLRLGGRYVSEPSGGTET